MTKTTLRFSDKLSLMKFIKIQNPKVADIDFIKFQLTIHSDLQKIKQAVKEYQAKIID